MHQLNSKTNDLGNCFLSPVATDGKDGNGLKLEKIRQFFQVLMLRVPKIFKSLLWVALSDKIHLISLSQLYRSILFMIKASK